MSDDSRRVLSDTERQRIFRMALEQAQSDRDIPGVRIHAACVQCGYVMSAMSRHGYLAASEDHRRFAHAGEV